MMTLADTIEDFLADMSRRRNWRPTTIDAYRCDLTVAARHLTMPLTEITEAGLDLVLQDTQLAITTRHRRCASLKQFFTWAVRQDAKPTLAFNWWSLRRVLLRFW